MLDCGDHSCWFAEEKSGQRTNGGCRCLSGTLSQKTKMELHRMAQENREMKRRIKELETENAELLSMLMRGMNMKLRKW
jgi:hypothetical protein